MSRPSPTRRLRAAAFLVCFTGAGCGTVVDTMSMSGPRVYGGVQSDGYLVVSLFEERTEPLRWWSYPLLFCGALIDLPFSIAADTLLLPLTIPVNLIQDDEDEDQEQATVSGKTVSARTGWTNTGSTNTGSANTGSPNTGSANTVSAVTRSTIARP